MDRIIEKAEERVATILSVVSAMQTVSNLRQRYAGIAEEDGPSLYRAAREEIAALLSELDRFAAENGWGAAVQTETSGKGAGGLGLQTTELAGPVSTSLPPGGPEEGAAPTSSGAGTGDSP